MKSGVHDATQRPVGFVVGGEGKLRGGCVLDYLKSPNRKTCSLYLSMLAKAGLYINEFTDSKEPLSDV